MSALLSCLTRFSPDMGMSATEFKKMTPPAADLSTLKSRVSQTVELGISM